MEGKFIVYIVIAVGYLIFNGYKKLKLPPENKGEPYQPETKRPIDPIEELIQEIYDQVGQFSFERIDLHLEESQKKTAMERCSNPNLATLGGKKVVKIEDMDGYKFHFEGGGWLMVRPSGTEPVLRTYCEDISSESAIATLKKAHADLLA